METLSFDEKRQKIRETAIPEGDRAVDLSWEQAIQIAGVEGEQASHYSKPVIFLGFKKETLK